MRLHCLSCHSPVVSLDWQLRKGPRQPGYGECCDVSRPCEIQFTVRRCNAGPQAQTPPALTACHIHTHVLLAPASREKGETPFVRIHKRRLSSNGQGPGTVVPGLGSWMSPATRLKKDLSDVQTGNWTLQPRSRLSDLPSLPTTRSAGLLRKLSKFAICLPTSPSVTAMPASIYWMTPAVCFL